ncbi:hypothetical protein K435DRAFT_65081 [Dendrothele bispora CBS 962.96]|uniref:Uncharacterized protein n=1 Tax=Dendrothele bispora (strain CBS 962.96) TaxID=1314807 RepID=A0A4S8KR15_DENBC|nr:hypothetical protein K435DRAFT_65081 [Dendrothele bispora CBS 962.96]
MTIRVVVMLMQSDMMDTKFSLNSCICPSGYRSTHTQWFSKHSSQPQRLRSFARAGRRSQKTHESFYDEFMISYRIEVPVFLTSGELQNTVRVHVLTCDVYVSSDPSLRTVNTFLRFLHRPTQLPLGIICQFPKMLESLCSLLPFTVFSGPFLM